MTLKIIRGHLHQPAASPLDEYKPSEARAEAAAQAREQRGQSIASAQQNSTWHGKK